MLIILCGIDTISKRLLSRQIVGTLNTFEVDGYTVDFTQMPYVFTKDDKTLVQPDGPKEQEVHVGEKVILSDPPTTDPDLHENYGEGTPVTNSENVPPPPLRSVNPIPTPPGQLAVPKSVLDKASEIMQGILADEADNDYKNFFVRLDYDYGHKSTLEWVKVSYPESTPTIQEVIEHYKNRKYFYFPITGNFSRGAIDLLKFELGPENVLVYNFVRNPSVAYALNRKSDQWYTENPVYTYKDDTEKLENSILSSINLSRFNDIKTYKFEEMLAKGSFEINNKTVALPINFVKFNEHITTYEKTVLDLGLETSNEIDKWNETLSNYLSITDNGREVEMIDGLLGDVDNNRFSFPNDPSFSSFIQDIRTARSTFTDTSDRPAFIQTLKAISVQYKDLIGKMVPADIFAELGYTPLTLSQFNS